MAQESFDVMISDQQYKELKQFKNKNVQLQEELRKMEEKAKQQQKSSQELLEVVLNKDVEIGFLVGIVQEVASGSNQQDQGEGAAMKSNIFELLGQSMIDPRRSEEKKIEAIREELNKRYQPLLKKVTEVSERIESQQELITKLNRMNEETKQSVLKEQNQTVEELRTSLKTLEKEGEASIAQLDKAQAKIVQLTAQLRAQKDESEKKIAALQANIKKQHSQSSVEGQSVSLRNELKLVTKRLQECNFRINDLEIENAILKQGLGSSTFSKDQTKDKLKALIDDYVREVERSLKSIGGLSQAEVKELMHHEMKEIRDYIPNFGPNRK